MKKIKYLIILMMFFLKLEVKAENLTNISIFFDEGNLVENSYSDSYIYFEAESFSNNEYRVLITKDSSNLPETVVDPNEGGLIRLSEEDNSNRLYILGTFYFETASLYGDVYFTFYEYDGDVFNKVSDSVFFKRPNYLPLTHRIVAQFYNDKSLDVNVNDIYSENSTIKFKIGEITDTELLKKLDGSSDMAYNLLLEYAANDVNPLQKNQIKINERSIEEAIGNYPNLYDGSKIFKDKYYYGYFEIDTENGKYYPLVDVLLYESVHDGLLTHTNYVKTINPDDSTGQNNNIGSGDVVDSNDVDENITKNPITGNKDYVIIIITLLSFAIMLYFGIKKYKDFIEL